MFKGYPIAKGTTFGKLKVLKELPHKKPGARRFLCLCECGTEHPATGGNLRNGSVQSCGCWERNHSRKRPFEWLYNKFKWCAAKEGWANEIDFETFVAYTETKECHYCGAPIVWSPYASSLGERRSRAYNLDRKDTKLGYVGANIVVCCARCNYAKAHRFTYEEWKRIGEVIRSWR